MEISKLFLEISILQKIHSLPLHPDKQDKKARYLTTPTTKEETYGKKHRFTTTLLLNSHTLRDARCFTQLAMGTIKSRQIPEAGKIGAFGSLSRGSRGTLFSRAKPHRRKSKCALRGKHGINDQMPAMQGKSQYQNV